MFWWMCLIWSSLCGPVVAQAWSADFDRIVLRHREIIVLMHKVADLPPAQATAARELGRMLFHDQLESRERLSAWLLDRATPIESVHAFLDRLENAVELHDADKLAFREPLEDLAASLSASTLTSTNAALSERVQADLAVLTQIQALYEKELRAISDSLGQRSMPLRREAWESYLAFLQGQLDRASILRAHQARLVVPEPTSTRGPEQPSAEEIETYGRQMPPRTLLLTFDDGPHPRHTRKVLEILARYQLSAVFFAVGQNVGRVNADGTLKFDRRAEISREVLAAGSVLGNHSYSHANLPKLESTALDQEIDDTQTLLKALSADTPPLFRPPYGARNAKVLASLSSKNLRSVQWNIDSEDWADPVAASVAERVLAEVERQGRGIILFHDIHTRAVDALPTVLDTLIAKGYQFARWDGQDFTAAPAGAAAPVTTAATEDEPAKAPYRESWAVVIGIDAYQHWPQLRYAVRDAQGIENLLRERYGFRADHVFSLYNEQATRANILNLLGDRLADSAKVQREDRVMVFYAGHGATRRLASGRDLGYIIPVDAQLDQLHGSAISMTSFQDIAEAIAAKHLLFVMDSCYSGLGLTRSAGPGTSQNYLNEIARRSARQMFTAGGADQQVADSGPNGHSVFTWALLRALGGEGDQNGDGVITASELAAWTSPMVSSMSKQTPAFGNLPGSEGGEFFFELGNSGAPLNQLSAQLDASAGELGAELARLREEIARKSQRNSALALQLAAAQRSLEQLENQPAGSRSAGTTESAIQHNEQGMVFYQRQDYARALAEFLTAAELDPAYALAANNVGFVYFKLGQHQDAVNWYERTIRIDPQRAIAWLNAADAYVELQRIDDAEAAYRKYLELKPDSTSADYARRKLAELRS